MESSSRETTFTRQSDTDINESWDLEHKSRNPCTHTVHQWLGLDPGLVREACWMYPRSAGVSFVLLHSFSMPSNPVVENAARTLSTSTDSNESRDLAHKSRAVISAIKTKNAHDFQADTLKNQSIQDWCQIWTDLTCPCLSAQILPI